MKKLLTLHSKMSRIMLVLFLLSFGTIQSKAQCLPTNTVVNGTFTTSLSPWTASPGGGAAQGWYFSSGKAEIQVNNAAASLTQSLTNLDKAVRTGTGNGVITLTLTLSAGDYNNAGGKTASLNISLGGTLYATINNGTAKSTNNVTIAYANGAGGTFPTGSFGTSGGGYTDKTFNITMPYSGGSTANLVFATTGGANDVDDWRIDDVKLFVDLCAKISGNVFNDVNGNTDNKVNGDLYTTTGLNAILIDNTSGIVVATSAVTSGTYNFPSRNSGSYSVWITTNTAIVGNTPPAIVLPAGFVSTAEKNCGITAGCTGNDGTADGKINIGTVNSAITQVNFGIEQPPTVGKGETNNVTNPGGTNQVIVPPSTFTNDANSSDPVPGAVTGIRITAFPIGATSIVINNITYQSSVPSNVAALTALIIPTDANGNPTQTITLDPISNGVTTVDISFVALDAAGKESSNTTGGAGHAVINFVDLSVSNPDVNVTFVNVTVPGDVNTNDKVPTATTYGTPTPVTGNPDASTPTINTDGTYTFTSPVPGVFKFLVPVCAPTVTSNCPEELLTITVLDPLSNTNPPVANTDIATTFEVTPVTLNTLSNDKGGNSGVDLNATSVTITNAPSNGTTSINSLTGNITYTPNAGFTGKDTLTYQVCDLSSPALCATALQIITVVPTGTPNRTNAADDYNTTEFNTPVSGFVSINDTDPEGDDQAVTPQTTTVPGKGTLVLLADGSYTFSPESGFSGPVNFVYTICDDGTPQACADATLYIIVEAVDAQPDLTPRITFNAASFIGTSSIEISIRVSELAGAETNGLITMYVEKNYLLSNYSFTSLSTVNSSGQSVENSLFNVDFTSDPDYVIITTNSSIAASGFKRLFFTATLTPGSSNGKSPISVFIIDGSGSETIYTNNNDDETFNYFPN